MTPALAPHRIADESVQMPELHICVGTIKAFRVRTADGEVLGHFDTAADAGHACRSAVAAAARVVGRVAS